MQCIRYRMQQLKVHCKIVGYMEYRICKLLPLCIEVILVQLYLCVVFQFTTIVVDLLWPSWVHYYCTL